MVLGQFFCRFTGSAAQLEHTACARRHGPQLVSKKFLEEEIFAGTNFRELAFDRENREIFCLAKISRYTVPYFFNQIPQLLIFSLFVLVRLLIEGSYYSRAAFISLCIAE